MKAVKIIIRTINTLIVTAAVILAVMFVGVRLLGVQLYAVLSGSMEPEYPVGSLIYVVKTDPAELTQGDVITYYLTGETVSTHRIVEVIPDENDSESFQFRTKGDANDTVDAGLVDSDRLIGKPVVTFPKLGYFASYIQSSSGKRAALAVGGALILFVLLTDSFTHDKKKKRGEDEPEI